ncbi:MAG: hypothetical protein PSV24_06895 [Rhodoferax sp.]|nr:hypothetical protein [Rhodoferax sp.]
MTMFLSGSSSGYSARMRTDFTNRKKISGGFCLSLYVFPGSLVFVETANEVCNQGVDRYMTATLLFCNLQDIRLIPTPGKMKLV